MTIQQIQDELQQEFELFGTDWELKYEHLISMGNSLIRLNPEEKTETRLIKGCQSNVWLLAELKDGKVFYKADSDAIITRGMIALIIRVLNGQYPEDISNASFDFLNKIGLISHLSPTRANGLLSMIRQMKLYAITFTANPQ